MIISVSANPPQVKQPMLELNDVHDNHTNFYAEKKKYDDDTFNAISRMDAGDSLIINNISEENKKIVAPETQQSNECQVFKNYMGVYCLPEKTQNTADMLTKSLRGNPPNFVFFRFIIFIEIGDDALQNLSGIPSPRERKTINLNLKKAEKKHKDKFKYPYWINFAYFHNQSAFQSTHTLNFHSSLTERLVPSEIYQMPKSNPDPFLTLTHCPPEFFGPVSTIEQALRVKPPKLTNTNINEIDKHINSFLIPSTSFYSDESYKRLTKESIINNLNAYDAGIFKSDQKPLLNGVVFNNLTGDFAEFKMEGPGKR